MNALKKSDGFKPRKGPVVLAIMDGVGNGPENEGNAVWLAHTPTLDMLRKKYLTLELAAHGPAVGMPSWEDMGNSEVGHNALGAGRVFDQGAKRVNAAIEEGDLFRGEVWKELISRCVSHHGALHLIGLLSDGNVHSHIDHLFALIRRADSEGVGKLCVHPLLDGRDVPEDSAFDYIDPLEALLGEISAKPDRDYCIASGGGRMNVTMDRYFADWSIVKRGWDAHVHGKGKACASAREAIASYREETPGIGDQFLGEFVVKKDGKPVGAMENGDSVVFFNFRGDRAIEISMAFDNKDFDGFDRGEVPDLLYAGMMQYDGDLKLPNRFLVTPPAIQETVSEYLAHSNVHQMAISETQKFGHVTYFWNGNRSGKFDERLERYVEVPSDRVPFEQRPWMKAAEITDEVLKTLKSGEYPFIRLNFANGDMVGHTGDLRATRVAVESVDLCLARILKAVTALGGVLLVTADHGNADEMIEIDKKTKKFKVDDHGKFKVRTSHTLNPVPFIFADPVFADEYKINAAIEKPGLSHVAATLLFFLGFEAPAAFDPSLVVSA
ncbi:MAG: 2,3-bisphosphoglycerate-independent phosphoglycerate mutase [Planctomycetota bacterium]